MAQYRFGSFLVSPRRRVLSGDGRELPLIPRYFDLLVFLIEHRHEAVHRRDIFERVWGGVAVSDSALTQAIRTLRRTLDDDPREPRYIRTVSRHGYQFVFAGLVEEEEPIPVAPDTPAVGLRPMLRTAVPGCASGALGGGAAGILAGLAGGAILLAAPESRATLPLLPVLATIGAVCGALGGAGVSGGLAAASVITSSGGAWRLLAGGMAGGAVVGLTAQLLGQAILATLLGKQLPVGGGLEGLLIGGAAGCGYALSTAPAAQASARFGLWPPRLPIAMAAACGAAALVLTLAGRPLVGGTIHRVALASQGSQATLAPLGALLGEEEFGPISRTIVGTAEGVLFGLGLALGLTRLRLPLS
jgi:DNA-binding winged helix-turn-helix (wHTH) protein